MLDALALLGRPRFLQMMAVAEGAKLAARAVVALANERPAVRGPDATPLPPPGQPLPSTTDEEALKRSLVAACHILTMEGQGDDVLGHVSARLPGWDRFWMKPSGFGMEEVSVDDLLLVSLDGEVLAGRRTRHVEYPIHAEIMRARPDVLAVVHTHAPHSIALAASGRPLCGISQPGRSFLPQGVPVFERTSDLITTHEMGRWVSDALGDASAVFLLNHGIAVRAESIEQVCVSALQLERACWLQLLAESDGRTARFVAEPLPEAGQAALGGVASRFNYFARKAQRWRARQGLS